MTYNNKYITVFDTHPPKFPGGVNPYYKGFRILIQRIETWETNGWLELKSKNIEDSFMMNVYFNGSPLVNKKYSRTYDSELEALTFATEAITSLTNEVILGCHESLTVISNRIESEGL